MDQEPDRLYGRESEEESRIWDEVAMREFGLLMVYNQKLSTDNAAKAAFENADTYIRERRAWFKAAYKQVGGK